MSNSMPKGTSRIRAKGAISAIGMQAMMIRRPKALIPYSNQQVGRKQ